MKHLTKKLILSVSLLTVITTPAISAELPSGNEIAQKINARNEGVAAVRNLKMEMTDRQGKVRVRETRAYRKYYGDEKRTAIFT